MSYATDFYKTSINGELNFICSVGGSDAPWHFENVKSLEDVEDVLHSFEKESDIYVWYKWAVPWEDSRTSDDCVIFEVLKRKVWEFWKPKTPVKFWKDTNYEKYESLKNTRQLYFTSLPLREAYSTDCEEDWILSSLKLFTLPQMRIKPNTKPVL